VKVLKTVLITKNLKGIFVLGTFLELLEIG